MIERMKICSTRKEYYQANSDRLLVKQKEYRNTLRGLLIIRWDALSSRCCNPKNERYCYYGGKGIKNKFESFESFFKFVTVTLELDSVAVLQKLHIHRIDNDGDYEESNVEFIPVTKHMGIHNGGEGNPSSKLNDDKVVAIRSDYAAKLFTQKELAEMYDVSTATINRIINRKIWKHVI